ncbi:MAG: hypothetical protein H0X26_07680 [Alphaproteobacteria bacterium]|nr:hypothetical protein [Alphaproteobacteria bacterium]
MYRIRNIISLLALFLLGITGINAHIPATTPMTVYEKKLLQAAKMDRLFQLPKAQVLNQAISPLMLEYFLEKSGLIEKIADRQLRETGIYMAVALAFYDYEKFIKENMPPAMIEHSLIHEEMKIRLIDAIISNSLVL